MKKILKLYKKMSETPLECLERFRKENPEYAEVKMTYAGRLDPMAEGELLVLVGEECKNKEAYLGLDKEYEMDILFGFSTDTYDILGLLEKNWDLEGPKSYDIAGHGGKVKRFLEKMVGEHEQEYPSFSSKTIKGKQLFQIAKDGELEDHILPTKNVKIYENELLKNYFIKGRELKGDIMKRVLAVQGDFRQEEILKRWEKILKGQGDTQFLVSTIRVKCSGGVYMRNIAVELGKFLGIPALALKIKRTKIFDTNNK
ncbi:MAG: hypothetical protein V1851_00315 [Patescibacteria group bacterium]